MTPEEKLIALCRVLNEHSINGHQLSVLSLIPKLSAKEIAAFYDECPANTYSATRSLIRRGYIEKEKNPENKKYRILSPTKDKGIPLMNELAKVFV